MSTFNLTPKRIQALRFIGSHPDCMVGAVAQEVLTGATRTSRGLWSQQATRAGAGYCKKLQEQGYVRINTYVDYGYGTVHITPKGESLLKSLDNQNESLSDVVARCIE